MQSKLKKKLPLLLTGAMLLTFLLTETVAVGEVKASDLPALVISEVYANTPGKDANEYLELVNISNVPVDLYNYKLMNAAGQAVDKPTERQVMLADKQGQYVLAPGECAIVWFIHADTVAAGKTSLEDFISKTKKEEGARAEGLEKRMIIPLDVTTPTDHSNDRLKFNVANTDQRQILICPRNGIWSDAICSLTYNDDPEINDATTGLASIWKLDESGKKMVRLNNATEATPGYLSEGQTVSS
jgi:hypothetical protein